MASASVQGTAGKTTTAVNTDPTPVTLPAGISAGEGILVVGGMDSGAGTIAIGAGSSAGWQILDQQAHGTAHVGHLLWNPSALGGGSDVLEVDAAVAEHGSWAGVRVSGHDSATTPVLTSAQSTAANPTPPTLTMGSVKDWLVFAMLATDASVVPTGAPAGYSGLDSQAGDVSGASVALSYKSVTGSSESPGAWTVAIEDHVLYVVAIAPAVAGTSPMFRGV